MSLTFSAFLFMINMNKILSSDTGKRGANPPRYRRCKVEHLTVATGKLGRRQMYGSQVRISAGCAVQGAADYSELCDDNIALILLSLYSRKESSPIS